MKSNFEIAQEINTLAKEHYKDSALALAFSWGCAAALLTATQLDLILTQIKEKEISLNS